MSISDYFPSLPLPHHPSFIPLNVYSWYLPETLHNIYCYNAWFETTIILITSICMYVYMYAHACVYACFHACVYACMCVCMCINICMLDPCWQFLQIYCNRNSNIHSNSNNLISSHLCTKLLFDLRAYLISPSPH